MRVLLVCTGNVCRSPVAEVLLREHWAGARDVSVSSAGTRALVGEPIYPPIRKVMAARNLPDLPFAATQVTPDLIAAADLVLVMTREHRAAVVALHPASVRRTFTLREFARIAPLGEPALGAGSIGRRLAALVPVTARLRGRARASAAEDGIEDPFERGSSACRSVVDRIGAAVDDIVGIVGTEPRLGGMAEK